MFRSISWSDYFNFLWIALLIYYPAIGLLFYRKQWGAMIKRRSDWPAMASCKLACADESDEPLFCFVKFENRGVC